MSWSFFLVDKATPAFDVCKRICKADVKPGRVFPVTAVELESWREDVELVTLSDRKLGDTRKSETGD